VLVATPKPSTLSRDPWQVGALWSQGGWCARLSSRGCWLARSRSMSRCSQTVRQDASGVHEAAMRAIAAVTRETPDTPAAAALA
jgi:hypothetical protein